MILLAPPARAGFGVDTPVTSGPWSRFLSTNNAHCVAVDSEGNVHVIYGAFEFNNGYDQEVLPVYRMYDRELGVWSPPSEIADPADRVVCWWNVAIATDCHDNVHMVWVQMVAGPDAGLLYRMRHADGTWDPIEVVPGANSLTENPSIAVDRHGDVFVCWAEGYWNTDSAFLYNVACQVRNVETDSWDATRWLTDYHVGADLSPGAKGISVALQGFEGTEDVVAHFAWLDGIAGHVAYTGLTRSCEDGTYGALPPPLYFDGEPRSPSIAQGCRRVRVVWDADGACQHRVGTTGGAPGIATFLAPVATGLPEGDPNIAVDGLGNAHMVLNGVVHAEWSLLDETWTVTGDVDDDAGWTESQSIAVDPLGDLHVIWADHREPSAGHIYYDRGACMVHAMQDDLPALSPVVLPLDLQGALQTASLGDRLPVIIQMRKQADLDYLERRLTGVSILDRRRIVVAELQELADRTQVNLRDELALAEHAGETEQVRPLWIVNAIAAHVSPDLVDRLAARSDVEAILYDPPQQLIEGSGPGTGGYADPLQDPPPPDIAWGISWIGAPDVWDMGFRGQCILVAVLDTGIGLTYPDLVNRLWVNADEIPGNGIDDDGNGEVDDVNGYDFAGVDGDPTDAHGHGTHVAGTIAGDGTGGTITGVTMCIAAGNEHCADRPPNEIENPGDIPPPWIGPDQPSLGATSGVTTVGATGYTTEEIAPFSARGPVDWSQTDFPFGDWKLCDPVTPNVGLIKPDLCAPGTRILSTQLGGGYVGENGPSDTWWSGTSIATPHVAGLVALMLSKNHELLSPEIEEILETSAIDLGTLGKDNTYGAGRVSAPNAIVAVAAQTGPTLSLAAHTVHDTVGTANGDGRLDAGEDADLVVSLRNNGPYMLGDVVARLEADTIVTILKETTYFGDFLVNETKDNEDDPFRVRVPPDATDGSVVTFTLTITAYGVCQAVSFSDTLHEGGGPCPHIADHDAGGVRFSVTDQGIAGFFAGDHGAGSGFVFPKSEGTNRLFIGSFWAGTDGAYVLNRDYDDDPIKDWDPLGCVSLRPGEPGDPIPADQVGLGSYDDSGNPSPQGLEVVQRSYAWADPPDDEFVILTYEVTNHGSQAMRSLWLGLFMDWDLDEGGGYGSNLGGVDADRDLVYMWRETGGDGTYVGIRSLSHSHPLQMSLIRNST